MKKRSKIGKRIKRSIILLLILAAVGAVFYFGYYQFQLPADTYGVIFTKYTGNGWDHDVVKPGEFRFEWQGLIPMNLSMEKFLLFPKSERVSLEGELPSAELYGMYLEGNPSFEYSYSFDIVYTVKAETLNKLASDEFLREINFESWIDEIETGLASDASGFIRTMAEDYDYMNRISYNYSLMEDDLKNKLGEAYPYLDFVSFVPVNINFPDLALYAEGRRQYFEMEKFHSDIEKMSLEKTTSRLVEESAKLEILEKYGALFSKYPALIDYYAIFPDDAKGLLPAIDLSSPASDDSEAELQQLMRGSN
ncbi:MAG: hypothetical protein PQJ61_03670 [Spirochaetales bacterium]|uniref:Band 7 domain-containing protein n=1 Tax=Candidatus Thalassospirochaeta sargassi TaxID=3119039 RepID=A0AAJ1IAT3_9SPIO|nr:hypothetical protein [Spirochaetales bacterium]